MQVGQAGQGQDGDGGGKYQGNNKCKDGNKAARKFAERVVLKDEQFYKKVAEKFCLSYPEDAQAYHGKRHEGGQKAEQAEYCGQQHGSESTGQIINVKGRDDDSYAQQNAGHAAEV